MSTCSNSLRRANGLGADASRDTSELSPGALRYGSVESQQLSGEFYAHYDWGNCSFFGLENNECFGGTLGRSQRTSGERTLRERTELTKVNGLPAPGTRASDGRFLPSGDEAGTAPEDRPFRPDVEGLRAVAVLLVVLFHAGLTQLSGGFVGVDVFFVISGFVITGLLLRERKTSDRTSILAFYGRRSRRIIPAATLVIVVTVVFSYHWLGFISGNRVATDGKWAAVFLSNFHFIRLETNYFSSSLPPSPLLNFWSLAVEEQFYFVFPTFFLLVAGARSRLSLRARLGIALALVLSASLIWSIVQTTSNPTAAYFSPLTRAWELALGALVALATKQLVKLPKQLAAAITWLGLGAICVAALAFNSQTPYPGSLVAVPVVGTALVIAGGTAAPRMGVELLLGLPPVRWLGKLSYSLYLWHWPILIIAAERQGKSSLPMRQNLVWILVAVMASIATYYLLENPIRHAKLLSQIRWASIGLGVGLVAVTVGLLSVELQVHNGPGAGNETATKFDVQQKIADQTFFGPCVVLVPSTTQLTSCVGGDRASSKIIVLVGDSHAGAWFRALSDAASSLDLRLVGIAEPGCPAIPVVVKANAPIDTQECLALRKQVHQLLNNLKPRAVVLTQHDGYLGSIVDQQGNIPAPGVQVALWRQGFATFLRSLRKGNIRPAVILDNPTLPEDPAACVAQKDSVSACDPSRVEALKTGSPLQTVELQVLRQQDVPSFAPDKLLCDSDRCFLELNGQPAYIDDNHLSSEVTRTMEPQLRELLQQAVQEVG